MKLKKTFSKKNIFSIICISFCAVIATVSAMATNLVEAQNAVNPETSNPAQPSIAVTYPESLLTQISQSEKEETLEPAPQTYYALYIDNKIIAVTEKEDEISTVLNKIKSDVLKEYSYKNAVAEFTQNVEIKEGIYENNIVTSEELTEILSTPTENEILYTIQDGDAPYSICDKYNLTLEEFAELNGDNFEDYMYGGTKVKVKEEKKLLSVKVTVEKTYTKAVEFQTETTYDDNDYADNRTVTQKGKNGQTKYVDEISYIDGKEVSRTNISQTVISEPITEKVTVGTIEHHYGYASGSFLWPVPNYSMISSTFGPRWGTNHNGMDIAGSGIYGADIIASDGGTVTLSQYDNSGYGMHIIIDHGNGFETHYAHCSELYVSVGEQVYAGQVIAAVGSTGDSTGPHLHFEIISNGTKIDPQLYV